MPSKTGRNGRVSSVPVGTPDTTPPQAKVVELLGKATQNLDMRSLVLKMARRSCWMHHVLVELVNLPKQLHEIVGQLLISEADRPFRRTNYHVY